MPNAGGDTDSGSTADADLDGYDDPSNTVTYGASPEGYVKLGSRRTRGT